MFLTNERFWDLIWADNFSSDFYSNIVNDIITAKSIQLQPLLMSTNKGRKQACVQVRQNMPSLMCESEVTIADS